MWLLLGAVALHGLVLALDMRPALLHAVEGLMYLAPGCSLWLVLGVAVCNCRRRRTFPWAVEALTHPALASAMWPQPGVAALHGLTGHLTRPVRWRSRGPHVPGARVLPVAGAGRGRPGVAERCRTFPWAVEALTHPALAICRVAAAGRGGLAWA